MHIYAYVYNALKCKDTLPFIYKYICCCVYSTIRVIFMLAINTSASPLMLNGYVI